jgi:hypothetical protein
MTQLFEKTSRPTLAREEGYRFRVRFQSALTRWCLMEDILRKLGVRERHA